MIPSPVRILLVEDEPAHAELILRSFEPFAGEFLLQTAASLAHARACLAQLPLPNLIITDWRLPDGEGNELISQESILTAVPVVMLTSKGNERMAVEALQSGAVDYVVKSDLTFTEMPHIARRAMQAWDNQVERHRTRLALQESELRFRSLFENASVGIYRTTPDGHILDANPYLLRMLGFNHLDELLIHNLEYGQLLDKSVRQQFKTLMHAHGAVRGLESIWKRRDGTPIYVRESANIVHDEFGQVTYEGTVEDITERKRAELQAAAQARNLHVVSRLATQLAGSLADENYYAWIADQLRDLIGAIGVTISIYDPAEHCLVVKHVALPGGLLESLQSILEKWLPELKVKLNAEQVAEMLARKTERATSLSRLTFGAVPEGPAELIQRLAGIGEIAVSVLHLEDDLLGALAIFMPVGAAPVSLEMLAALAHVVTVTLRRKRDEADLRRINRALRMTSACNQTLVRAADERSLLRDICRIVVESGGYRFAWIGLPPAGDWRRIEPVAQWGLHTGLLRAETDERLSMLTLLPGLIPELVNGQPVLIPALHLDPRTVAWQSEARNRQCQTAIIFPLLSNASNLGVLCIFAGAEHQVDAAEMALLGEMADDLAFGIYTLRERSEKKRAEALLEKSNADLEAAYDATLAGWSRTLEMRESETAGHSQRVVKLVTCLASQAGLAETDLVQIRRGALLHDIGKMGVPDNILLKPGALTGEEWEVMRKHPLYARHLLENITYLEPALEIPLYHHERWDGAGYPFGLRSEQIPLAARLFAVIDVWDALTNDRPYRPAWSPEQALHYIQENAGKHFDPVVVRLFVDLISRGFHSGREADGLGSSGVTPHNQG